MWVSHFLLILIDAFRESPLCNFHTTYIMSNLDSINMEIKIKDTIDFLLN